MDLKSATYMLSPELNYIQVKLKYTTQWSSAVRRHSTNWEIDSSSPSQVLDSYALSWLYTTCPLDGVTVDVSS